MASGDRTGTGTKGTCFLATDYLLTGASVPLVSSKKTNLKPLLVELEWYLKGTGNIGFRKSMASKSGTHGPMRTMTRAGLRKAMAQPGRHPDYPQQRSAKVS
jgi:thymidylate synthase